MSTLNGEITRIANGKSALVTSINTKLTAQGSSTIPAGTKIDGLSTYVDSLQIGGTLTPIYIDGRTFFFQGRRYNEIPTIFPDYIAGFTNMRRCFECDDNNSIAFAEHDLDDIDTSRVVDFQGCFQKTNDSQNAVIDLREWDMSNAEDCSYMFSNGTNHYGNVLFPQNTRTKPAKATYIFQSYDSVYCRLTTVDLGWLNTSYPDTTYYSNMFLNNSKITTINNFSLDYGWDTSTYQMPGGLTTLTWLHIDNENHSIARDYAGNFTLYLQNCSSLDPSGLVNVDAYTGQYTRTIRLSANSYNMLTQAQIDTLNNKGYTITHA